MPKHNEPIMTGPTADVERRAVLFSPAPADDALLGKSCDRLPDGVRAARRAEGSLSLAARETAPKDNAAKARGEITSQAKPASTAKSFRFDSLEDDDSYFLAEPPATKKRRAGSCSRAPRARRSSRHPSRRAELAAGARRRRRATCPLGGLGQPLST